MPFYTYILYSERSDRYYVGSCESMEMRFLQHNSGRNHSTKAGAPWQLKHTEEHLTRSAAVKRETEIKKKKSRKYIQWLISSAG
ncbi:GIY-YIG nuclease family protein [Pontibacter sp. MBLB2868]|uniref:GIY-YIG nuclease family protein n=1 Tax=Pontibacter sp. MBLB2868 TaxID=3451555 RepID=UPI003F752056